MPVVKVSSWSTYRAIAPSERHGVGSRQHQDPRANTNGAQPTLGDERPDPTTAHANDGCCLLDRDQVLLDRSIIPVSE